MHILWPMTLPIWNILFPSHKIANQCYKSHLIITVIILLFIPTLLCFSLFSPYSYYISMFLSTLTWPAVFSTVLKSWLLSYPIFYSTYWQYKQKLLYICTMNYAPSPTQRTLQLSLSAHLTLHSYTHSQLASRCRQLTSSHQNVEHVS